MISQPAAIATSRSRPDRSVALRDGERGRYHFRRDVGERGAVNVAHGDGGDQVAVQHRRAGERQAVAADDAALIRLRKACRERRQLVGFLALMARHRARERVEQHVLAIFGDALRDVFVFERGRELGQRMGHVTCHCNLLRICVAAVDAGEDGHHKARRVKRKLKILNREGREGAGSFSGKSANAMRHEMAR